MGRRWPSGLGALLATAIILAAYYLAADGQPRAQSPAGGGSHYGDAPLASRSPAYLFGFANAALAGCDFNAGAALDRLAAAVESGDRGVVPDELKAGFAEFQSLSEKRGTAAACTLAKRILGPHAPAWAGVLSPR